MVTGGCIVGFGSPACAVLRGVAPEAVAACAKFTTRGDASVALPTDRDPLLKLAISRGSGASLREIRAAIPLISTAVSSAKKPTVENLHSRIPPPPQRLLLLLLFRTRAARVVRFWVRPLCDYFRTEEERDAPTPQVVTSFFGRNRRPVFLLPGACRSCWPPSPRPTWRPSTVSQRCRDR